MGNSVDHRDTLAQTVEYQIIDMVQTRTNDSTELRSDIEDLCLHAANYHNYQTQSPLQNTLLDQRHKLHELPMPLQASVQAALVKCTTENILHSKSASRTQYLLGIDISFAGIYQTSTGDKR
jgi:hypothetical protein